MNKLPKYWCVKNDGSQLFKDTVIKYLNDTYNRNWVGENICYYGFDDNHRYNGTNSNYSISSFQNNPIELTLEEFIELSKEIKEFPRQWYINITNENIDTIEEWLGDHFFSLGDYSCVHYDKDACDTINVPIEYTEITFEQFKEFVLKEKSMEKIEKPLISERHITLDMLLTHPLL